MWNVITCGILFSFLCLYSFQSFAIDILGPKPYTAAQPTAKKYTEVLNLSQSDTLLNYTLIIKNGDGKDHPIKTCNQTNFFQKLICNIQNIPNNLYVQLFRASAFELKNNGVTIIPASQINKNVFYYKATLKLALANKLDLSVLGAASASVNVEIIKPDVPTDTTAPLISYNVKSNSITNNANSRILITDQSATTTTLSNNGKTVLTSSNKTIDYVLPEGTNNIIISSVDAYGNKSADYIVSQLTVDTKPAIVSHDLQSLYIVSQLPYLKTITITSNEALQSLQINNFNLIQTGLNTYSYAIQFDSAGVKTFSLKAIDLAGNETTQTLTTEIKTDTTAPVIATNTIPSIITSASFNLSVTITDDSTTNSEIFINNQSVLKTTDKSISYTIPFTIDETKELKIISTDIAGNSSVQVFAITKDTKPLYVNIISPQNKSILNTTLIEVRAKANKPLSLAKINGQLVQIGPDQISIKANIQQLTDGPYTVTVEVTDVSGTSAQQTVSVDIKSSALPSWTYEECPVNQ